MKLSYYDTNGNHFFIYKGAFTIKYDGIVNGLATNRRQAITWTNGDSV